jgi:hypothetical protein
MSCKVDELPAIQETPGIPDAVQQGTWRVTLLSDSDADETYHFTDYAFTFDTTGIVIATKDSSSVHGTWRVVKDDHYDELIIDFGSTVPFKELNDDWTIIEKTDVKIRLEDISGGNEPNDYLTFEKN